MHAIEGTISRFSEGTNNPFALRKPAAGHVLDGSTSAVSGFLRHGCFTPETGHWLARLARQKSAKRSNRRASRDRFW
jgi:hypothetical protein